jgi:hypothetical protein
VSLVALVGIFFLVLSKPNHRLCRLTFSDREGVFQTKLIGSRCGLPGGRYRYNYRIGWHPFIPSGLDASFNFHEIIPIRPSTASAIFRLRFHYRLLHRFLRSSVRLLVCLRLCGLEPIERGTNCRPPNRFLRVLEPRVTRSAWERRGFSPVIGEEMQRRRRPRRRPPPPLFGESVSARSPRRHGNRMLILIVTGGSDPAVARFLRSLSVSPAGRRGRHRRGRSLDIVQRNLRLGRI